MYESKPDPAVRIATAVLAAAGVRRMWTRLAASWNESPEAFAAEVARNRRRMTRTRPPTRLARRIVAEDIDGRTMHVITPDPDAADNAIASARGILFLHGGAYVYGPGGPHWHFAARLAKATSRPVGLFDYPKAPESGIDDAIAGSVLAFDRLRRRCGGGPVAIAGDSAGGGLAVALVRELLRTRGEDALSSIDRLVLLSPWLDVTLSNPGIAPIESRDVMLGVDGLRACGEAFVGSARERREGGTDLLRGPQSPPRFPPTDLYASDAEILLPDAEELVRRLSEAGTAATLSVSVGMPHDWVLFPFPESRSTFEAVVGLLAVAQSSASD